MKKPIKGTCIRTGVERLFSGQQEASRVTGILASAISNNLKGRSKSAGNLKFQYV